MIKTGTELKAYLMLNKISTQTIADHLHLSRQRIYQLFAEGELHFLIQLGVQDFQKTTGKNM